MRRYWPLLVGFFVLLVGPTMIAQNAQATADTVAGVNALGQQSFASLLLSFFMPRVLEFLKRWKAFPLIQEGAAKLNRLIAILVSVVQGTGLTWAYHAATGGSGGWQFVLGSKHSTFEEWVVACLVAFAAQQFFYEQLPTVRADAMARALAAKV